MDLAYKASAPLRTGCAGDERVQREEFSLEFQKAFATEEACAHHLHAYLSEVAYRFNLRHWEKELFDRLVTACVSTGTLTYHQLTTPDEGVVS